MPILAPRGVTPLDKGAPRLCARCEISENSSRIRKKFYQRAGAMRAVLLTRCLRAGCAFCVRAPDSDKRLDLDSEGLADAPPTHHQPPPAQGRRASDDDALLCPAAGHSSAAGPVQCLCRGTRDPNVLCRRAQRKRNVAQLETPSLLLLPRAQQRLPSGRAQPGSEACGQQAGGHGVRRAGRKRRGERLRRTRPAAQTGANLSRAAGRAAGRTGYSSQFQELLPARGAPLRP